MVLTSFSIPPFQVHSIVTKSHFLDCNRRPECPWILEPLSRADVSTHFTVALVSQPHGMEVVGCVVLLPLNRQLFAVRKDLVFRDKKRRIIGDSVVEKSIPLSGEIRDLYGENW